jgi:hypothetical protein
MNFYWTTDNELTEIPIKIEFAMCNFIFLWKQSDISLKKILNKTIRNHKRLWLWDSP